MLLGFHGRIESRSSFFANGRIRDDPARLFLPLFNQSGIGHDFDLSLIIGKTHPPAEALFVKAAKLRLIVVMIGRTKKRSAQTTTGDIREISFDRLRQRGLDFVKIVVRELKCPSLEKFSIKRNCAILAELVKRRLRRCGQTDFVAFRFFQEGACQGEKRIGNCVFFDLRDDIFEDRRTRQKSHRDWRRDHPRNFMSILTISILRWFAGSVANSARWTVTSRRF